MVGHSIPMSATGTSTATSTPQVKSPACSIRWGEIPSRMTSPRVSLDVFRTSGGIPVLGHTMSRPTSRQEHKKKVESHKSVEKKQKKESKGIMHKIKEHINSNTNAYWNENIAYSGVFARV